MTIKNLHQKIKSLKFSKNNFHPRQGFFVKSAGWGKGGPKNNESAHPQPVGAHDWSLDRDLISWRYWEPPGRDKGPSEFREGGSDGKCWGHFFCYIKMKCGPDSTTAVIEKNYFFDIQNPKSNNCEVSASIILWTKNSQFARSLKSAENQHFYLKHYHNWI